MSSPVRTGALVLLLGLIGSPLLKAADTGSSTHPRAALVIGNEGYSAVIPPKNTGNDAHDMCQALTDLGYTASCFTDVKDTREFKARIQDFAAALKPKSEVVFYYAGHAIQVKGENYLVPVNAKLRAEIDIPKETVSLNYLMTQLLQAKHYLNIVILDTCRGSPWGQNSHGLTAGLAPITAIPRGTMVMYGTAAKDVADDGEGHNGTLTKNLLANIKTPGLTADEFFKHVSEGVQSDSEAAGEDTQTPALYTNFTGQFCFAGCFDKVARAEMERQQKANEELLAQANKEKAELEASNREAEATNQEAEAKLAATVISMNCDKKVLNDNGQCFAASPDMTIKATAAALTQRGFQVGESEGSTGTIEGKRSVDDPKDKKMTDVSTVTAAVKEIPQTGRCVVTLTASEEIIRHEEYHNWMNVAGLIPIPMSKESSDSVKKDLNIKDPSFFQDIFAAIDRNIQTISAGQATTPDGTVAQ